MGSPGIRSMRKSCPHCHKRVWVNLYVELTWDSLRKVLRLSKNPLRYDEVFKDGKSV